MISYTIQNVKKGVFAKNARRMPAGLQAGVFGKNQRFSQFPAHLHSHVGTDKIVIIIYYFPIPVSKTPLFFSLFATYIG